MIVPPFTFLLLLPLAFPAVPVLAWQSLKFFPRNTNLQNYWNYDDCCWYLILLELPLSPHPDYHKKKNPMGSQCLWDQCMFFNLFLPSLGLFFAALPRYLETSSWHWDLCSWRHLVLKLLVYGWRHPMLSYQYLWETDCLRSKERDPCLEEPYCEARPPQNSARLINILKFDCHWLVTSVSRN